MLAGPTPWNGRNRARSVGSGAFMVFYAGGSKCSKNISLV